MPPSSKVPSGKFADEFRTVAANAVETSSGTLKSCIYILLEVYFKATNQEVNVPNLIEQVSVWVTDVLESEEIAIATASDDERSMSLANASKSVKSGKRESTQSPFKTRHTTPVETNAEEEAEEEAAETPSKPAKRGTRAATRAASVATTPKASKSAQSTQATPKSAKKIETTPAKTPTRLAPGVNALEYLRSIESGGKDTKRKRGETAPEGSPSKKRAAPAAQEAEEPESKPVALRSAQKPKRGGRGGKA